MKILKKQQRQQQKTLEVIAINGIPVVLMSYSRRENRVSGWGKGSEVFPFQRVQKVAF
jgi:hypothetical protein